MIVVNNGNYVFIIWNFILIKIVGINNLLKFFVFRTLAYNNITFATESSILKINNYKN